MATKGDAKQILRIISLVAGAVALLLGAIVLNGWYTGNEAMIQVSEGFVPMQYNTALGFLLSGIGLLMLVLNKKKFYLAAAFFPLAVGFLTLIEYGFTVDLGIDQLFMEHYITVQTSNPGRMAPNTALSFLLVGVLLALVGTRKNDLGKSWVAGVFGSLILGLGVVSLAGYMTGLETAYGWGTLTRMAIHTAVGFVVLGAGFVSYAWYTDISPAEKKDELIGWLPVGAGVGVFTVITSMAQAINAQEAFITAEVAEGFKHIADEIIFIFGIFLAFAVGGLLEFAQRSGLRTIIAENAQADLAEKENFQNAIMDTMVDGLIVIDVDGEIQSINGAGLRMFGYKEGELVGKNAKILMRPEDFVEFSLGLKNFTKGKKQNIIGVPRFEALGVKKNGTIINLDLSGNPVKIYGKQFFVGSLRDSTLRKQAEKEALRFGRIIEDSLNEVYFFDAKSLKFISANRGARENLGFANEELKEKTFLDLNPEIGKSDFNKMLKTLESGEVKKLEFETRHQRKDETLYDAKIFLQISSSSHRPVLTVIGDDITDKKAAAEKLRQSQKMEEIGKLSAGIAHDFNNLLTAIHGSIQLMEHFGENLNDDMTECLEIAKTSTERGSDLTHRLLAFSRKQTLNPTVVEVNRMITGLVPMLRRTIPESIKIETHLGHEEMFVYVDEAELESSLLNLSVNARDAMKNGGTLAFEVNRMEIRGKVSGDAEIEPGQYIVIVVSDTGVGMTPEIRDQIFEPFFSTKDVGKGTGLGLSMVYGFVKQTGGYVHVYSEEGQGTTFKLFLKATQRKAAQVAKTKRGKMGTKMDAKILLVEDDEGVMKITRKALLANGFKVLEAVDAPSALEIIKNEKNIDLLLTDVVLPGEMSGAEIGEVFLKKFPRKPAIYTSGYSGVVIKSRKWLKNPNDLISKPYDLEALVTTIRSKLK